MKSNTRLVQITKTKLNVRLITANFDDEDDRNEKIKKKYNYNYHYYLDSNSVSDSDFNFNNHIREEQGIISNNEELDNCELLYTLIWFDCEDCRKLLIDSKNNNNKILYIDGGYYFFDENDETNTPLFYKNSELVATDIFSIYEELFYNKIIE
jgi:hypothetical protein